MTFSDFYNALSRFFPKRADIGPFQTVHVKCDENGLGSYVVPYGETHEVYVYSVNVAADNYMNTIEHLDRTILADYTNIVTSTIIRVWLPIDIGFTRIVTEYTGTYLAPDILLQMNVGASQGVLQMRERGFILSGGEGIFFDANAGDVWLVRFRKILSVT